MRAVIPFDLERFQPFLGRAHMIGHDRNSIVEPDDLAYTLDNLCRSIIEVLNPAAECGRLRQRRDLHAGRARIDARGSRAIDLSRYVEALCGSANQLEVFGRFSITLSGTGICAASAASSPYFRRRPVDL